MDDTTKAYREAYKALHGDYPSVKLIGKEYSIVTKSGFFAHYSKRDVENLTRGLRHLARKRIAA